MAWIIENYMKRSVGLESLLFIRESSKMPLFSMAHHSNQ